MRNCGMQRDKFLSFELISFEKLSKGFSFFFINSIQSNLFQFEFEFRWNENIRFQKFVRHRSQIEKKHLLFQKNGIFQLAILQIRRVLQEFQQLKFLPTLFKFDRSICLSFLSSLSFVEE